MQFPWIAFLPLLHGLALLTLIMALAYIKKNAALGGVLALIAFLCAATTAFFFVILWRGSF
jgi:hypothetical protein